MGQLQDKVGHLQDEMGQLQDNLTLKVGQLQDAHVTFTGSHLFVIH